MEWKRHLKKTISIIIIFLLLFPSIQSIEEEPYEKEEIQISNDSLTMRQIQTELGVFSLPRCTDCVMEGKPGEPIILQKAVKILIRNYMDLDHITIERGVPKVIELDHPLLPNQPDYRLSEEAPPMEMNEKIYTKDQWIYPEEGREQETAYKKGYPIKTILLNITDYNPNKNILYFYENISITLYYRKDVRLAQRSTNQLYRNHPSDKKDIQDIIENKNTMDSYPLTDEARLEDNYPGGLCSASDNYDYVIITNRELNSTTGYTYNWSDLLDHRSSQDGLSCCKIAWEDINETEAYWNDMTVFNDSAAKVREFCKDAYQDWGTEYILLGGSWQLNMESRQVVPCRIFTDVEESGSYDTIPCDLYFSNLDGDWYSDSESVWGAGAYGANDKLSELSVGRIPVWDAERISNAIDKILWYDNCQDEEFLSSAGFLGGDLGWASTSKQYMEEIRLGTGSYTYAQYEGFEEWNEDHPSDTINTSERYYDADYDTESDAVNAWKQAINNGEMSLISHLDHGSWLNTLSLLDGRDLSNSEYFIGTSQACLSGRYTSGDAGSCTFLGKWNDRGAFAMVLNTGYGYGSSSSTNGKSQFLHKMWWDYFFNDQAENQENWEIGKAMKYSKDEMSSYIDSYSHVFSYVWYSWNLFGDPAQQIRINNNNTKEIQSGTVTFTAEGTNQQVQQGTFSFTSEDRTSQQIQSGTISFISTSRTSQPIQQGTFSFTSEDRTSQQIQSGTFSFSSPEVYELSTMKVIAPPSVKINEEFEVDVWLHVHSSVVTDSFFLQSFNWTEGMANATSLTDEDDVWDLFFDYSRISNETGGIRYPQGGAENKFSGNVTVFTVTMIAEDTGTIQFNITGPEIYDGTALPLNYTNATMNITGRQTQQVQQGTFTFTSEDRTTQQIQSGTISFSNTATDQTIQQGTFTFTSITEGVNQIHPIANETISTYPPANLSVQVNGANMNISIYFLNLSGIQEKWTLARSWTEVNSGTYQFDDFDSLSYHEFSMGNMTYTWSVNISTGSTWDNNTYTFNTPEKTRGGANKRNDVYTDDGLDIVNIMDAMIIWHRRTGESPINETTDELPYKRIYDVNDDLIINIQDVMNVWNGRD